MARYAQGAVIFQAALPAAPHLHHARRVGMYIMANKERHGRWCADRAGVVAACFGASIVVHVALAVTLSNQGAAGQPSPRTQYHRVRVGGQNAATVRGACEHKSEVGCRKNTRSKRDSVRGREEGRCLGKQRKHGDPSHRAVNFNQVASCAASHTGSLSGESFTNPAHTKQKGLDVYWCPGFPTTYTRTYHWNDVIGVPKLPLRRASRGSFGRHL